jgi:hypothetical protein
MKRFGKIWLLMKYLHIIDAPFYIVAYLLKQDIGKCVEIFFIFFFQSMVINDPKSPFLKCFQNNPPTKKTLVQPLLGGCMDI